MDTLDRDSIEIEKSILERVGCQVIPLQFSNDEELVAAIRDADALLPRYVNIQRRHIEALTRCKVIAHSGISVDISMCQLLLSTASGLPMCLIIALKRSPTTQ